MTDVVGHGNIKTREGEVEYDVLNRIGISALEFFLYNKEGEEKKQGEKIIINNNHKKKRRKNKR